MTTTHYRRVLAIADAPWIGSELAREVADWARATNAVVEVCFVPWLGRVGRAPDHRVLQKLGDAFQAGAGAFHRLELTWERGAASSIIRRARNSQTDLVILPHSRACRRHERVLQANPRGDRPPRSRISRARICVGRGAAHAVGADDASLRVAVVEHGDRCSNDSVRSSNNSPAAVGQVSERRRYSSSTSSRKDRDR
jgi:hypothetical protein